MNPKQHAGERERIVRRYEYDDGWVVAADLGVADDDVDVDIVGETAIVVDVDGRVSETDFDLPGAVSTVDMNNGVLVVTGDR